MAGAALRALVAEELQRPVVPEVADLAARIAARHPSAEAVLYYGSTLRTAQLEGLMLDFYLIVGSYDLAYDSRWLARANRLLPPNVFPFQHGGLVAKYAVLSQDDLARLASLRTRNVSVWARFAQPSRMVWQAGDSAADRVIDSVARCAPTLFAAALPCLPERADALDLWRRAFALTYAAELRAERSGRADSVVDSDPSRYRAFTLPALAAAGISVTGPCEKLAIEFPTCPAFRAKGARAWSRRRLEGKGLTLLRLGKAAFTYAGGIEYLAWKIGRHSGQPIALRPWQRRWPLLGAATLLPRLLRQGAIR